MRSLFDRRTSIYFLATMVACCAGPTREVRAPTPGVPNLTVLSYNVNYGLAGDEATLRAIGAAMADVVLLQETNPAWEAALRDKFDHTYPHRFFDSQPAAGGLGVLSKLPIESVVILPAEAGWFPAMRVVLESEAGSLQVLNVHLRPPISDSGSVLSGYFSTPPIRRQEIEAFAARLDPNLPTLIAGDFNEGAGGGAVELLENRGFTDALAEFAPDAHTWRWRTSLGQITSTLDHVLYDRELEPLKAEVLPLGRSDHLPVLVRFEIRGHQHSAINGGPPGEAARQAPCSDSRAAIASPAASTHCEPSSRGAQQLQPSS